MNLSKNIINTITYYDILNFPLTSFEVWKYLVGIENRESGIENCTLGKIIEALENDDLKEHVEEFRGFFFLKGRKDLVARRIQNDKNSIVKFEIAKKVSKWLRYIPFVRMVAVTGTLAMKNCEKDSDIDFFVVLQEGRIFTGRLLVTLAVQMLGRRRYGKKIKNRICLNYFAATDGLEIQRKDLFAANEYSLVFLLFGGWVGREFFEANFDWIKKFKPNWKIPELAPAKYFVKHGKFSAAVQKSFEGLINLFFGDRIETWLKKWQITRIERNPLTQEPGAYIEYTDQNLIFLPAPQSPRIEEEWQRRIKNIVL